MAEERTLILLKPDALQRGITGKIISRIEERGLQIVGLRMIELDDVKCKEHYSHLVGKPFYPKLVEFMTSAPVIALVAQGAEAVKVVREMCGPTNARNAPAGTIRGDYSLSTQYNVIHASDSLETAKKEVARFFADVQIFAWNRELSKFTAAEDEK
ncbi:nucleoside-diphosphate kinase [Candidatus Micrarchaeota archaeon CG10_big_fil_rev_8_21_14_0_10_45_29]|nr:MAG: nucleoside-diphosphate kinase [Candidatus Micrarchaeota archaeon CG10_big_fil_rev_8_21_14_0_10_45_29]